MLRSIAEDPSIQPDRSRSMMRMKTSFELMHCSNPPEISLLRRRNSDRGTAPKIDWRPARGAMSVSAVRLVGGARRGARGRCYNSRLPEFFSASKRVYGCRSGEDHHE
jgi:hypothetical protein